MGLRVIRPGLATSVQDMGRYGFQKYGVVAGGAMDAVALRIANLLVGNEEGDAGLEITLIGPKLIAETDMVIAICGADLSPIVNGKQTPLWRPVVIRKGSVLQFGTSRVGCRAYMAVAGGIDVPEVMASRSTYIRARIGGYLGRALMEGDVVSVRKLPLCSRRLWDKVDRQCQSTEFATVNWCASWKIRPSYLNHPIVRIIRGPHFEHFTEEAQTNLFASEFRVTPNSDRMGFRLSGCVLQVTKPMELVSEAVSIGTIQVPPDGSPIVLMADRQTIGGYPKIAYVASVDLPLLSQVKPGGTVRFQEISLQAAQRLLLEREQELRLLKRGIQLMMEGR